MAGEGAAAAGVAGAGSGRGAPTAGTATAPGGAATAGRATGVSAAAATRASAGATRTPVPVRVGSTFGRRSLGTRQVPWRTRTGAASVPTRPSMVTRRESRVTSTTARRLVRVIRSPRELRRILAFARRATSLRR